MNAVSLSFGHGDLNKLCSKEEDAAVPIGMTLLKEQSAGHEAQDKNIDYHVKHQQVEEVASRIEHALLQDAQHCGWRWSPPKEVTITSVNASNCNMKKRAMPADSLTEVTTVKKRYWRHKCCIGGCENNDMNYNGKFTWITSYPPPLPANVSSRNEQHS